MIDQVIAITGADGFIGRRVVHACLAEGTSVKAFVGPPNVKRYDLPAYVDTISADINDVAALTKALSDASVVVHLAGPASVSASFQNPSEFVRVHTQGTASVIEVMQRLGIRRLVYVSSAEVYGQPSVNSVPEHYRFEARSPYAAAKIGAERLVEAMCVAGNLDACILRPFSIFGFGQSPQSLLSEILRQLGDPNAREIRLRDLRPVRDYCYVSDLVRSILLAAESKKSGLSICNIGTAVGTSVRQLAQSVVGISGRNLQVVESRSPNRPSECDISSLIADRSQAFKILGWQPQYSLHRGLEETLHDMELCP